MADLASFAFSVIATRVKIPDHFSTSPLRAHTDTRTEPPFHNKHEPRKSKQGSGSCMGGVGGIVRGAGNDGRHADGMYGNVTGNTHLSCRRLIIPILKGMKLR